MVAVTPRILAEGKTPSQWVAELEARGLSVSERTLRERARQLGACRLLGNAMILLPEHIDRIFEEPACRSSHTSEAAHGGSVDTLLMAADMSDRALERLTRNSQRRPSAKSKQQRGNVVSLDQMLHGQRTK